ncbi:hypothetical protein TWF730_010866 [Orbilia blumenaviensis]|uniref:Uncharacterized protein n=1 Tax=Orbilia blumenaviensis TaxID=1796055 RepID=A0AAV9UM90_9PEZI
MPSATMAANRMSMKPASVASISGPQDELNTHLGMLPSSPNILVLPAVSIPSKFSPNSPISPSGEYPAIDVRDLVSSAYAAYSERQELAEGFVVNHPSRGVILQKGWITLLAECAQLLLDTRTCETVDDAVAAVKAVCDGGIEEIETEEDVEVEIDISDTDTDRTPVIEEEPELEEEYDELNPLRLPHVTRLSRSSSMTSNSSSSGRSRFRTSDRSLSSATTKVEDSIDEIEENDKTSMVPLRMSRSTIDLHLPRSHSQASMRDRDGMVTPPPGALILMTGGINGAGGKRRSGGNGKEGKRFPVRAASMDNLSELALAAAAEEKRSSAPSNSIPRLSLVEKKRIGEKLSDERLNLMLKRSSEPSEPLFLRDKSIEKWKPQFQHSRSSSASHKLSRDSLLSSGNSPRISAQSFESRSSTPTRWSDEIPKKTKKVIERRKVKTVKTHPPLKFQEDVMLFLHDTETSPTFMRLVDAISVSINSIPSTPFTPSFPSPSMAYPSPPISPTTPTIIVEQAADRRVSISSVSGTPRLSLFPRPRTRDSDREPENFAELLKTRSRPPTKELPPIPTTRLITPVKKIDVADETPLVIQNEIRGILGDRMTAVRKFPTVVQGLALGMGLGLGLLNYGGGESMGNRFWSPVLGGYGAGASVDMIYAVGYERGCEKWGQRLVQRITSGVGRCGPAHCVSLSYLLSLSLRQLNPSAPNYTSQVHAALSGKYLVPQLEDYLSVNSNTRCLVITFDAATVPNTNLEPLRELRRVLDGARPDSSFKIISVIGGPVNGKEEGSTSPKMDPKNSSKHSPACAAYRTSPVSRKPPRDAFQQAAKPGPRATSPVDRSPPRRQKSSAALRADEKTLMRRRELEALSNMLIIQKADDHDAFEGHVHKISEQLREREDKTGSYKAFEYTFEEPAPIEESEEPVPEYTLQPDDEFDRARGEEEEEEEEDLETSYGNALMTVDVPRQQAHKTRSSTWSKMWSREGKKSKPKPNGQVHYASQEQVQGSAKAFKLLGLDNTN